MKRVLLVALFVAAAPVGAQPKGTAFNLECEGTRTTKAALSEEAEHYTTVYRIDLAQKKWCEGDCKGLAEIYSVQPTFLTLEVSTGGAITSYTRIDRETGAHEAGLSIGRGGNTVMSSWRGECRKADFGGFPSFETKF